jgi:hypothetical protein
MHYGIFSLFYLPEQRYTFSGDSKPRGGHSPGTGGIMKGINRRRSEYDFFENDIQKNLLHDRFDNDNHCNHPFNRTIGFHDMYKLLILSLFFVTNIFAQFTRAIEDNSFFIEEAYNQEAGVVQHIPNSYRSSVTGDIFATFTQEWPVGSQDHQFSYTVPYASMNGLTGIGDIMLNYRYQLIRSDDGLAVSPRFSVSVPTGNEYNGFGDGVIGYQVNLPVSKRWSNDMVTHFNLGGTVLPGVRHPISGSKELLNSYFGGGSVIYLMTQQFNVMVEALHTVSKTFKTPVGADYTGETIIAPGFRFAVDINDVQIVPGIAFPFTFASGNNHNGLFLYISFEHFF